MREGVWDGGTPSGTPCLRWGHGGAGGGMGGVCGGAYPRSWVATLASGSWQPGPGVTLQGESKILSPSQLPMAPAVLCPPPAMPGDIL